MITQNPIVGRSKKKLAGVYARTLWGKNIIQSCPGPSTVKPTQALQDSRAAFKRVMLMANIVPTPILYNMYYAAPVGRSRRSVLASQLFTGVQRENKQVSFDLTAISELGTNQVAATVALVYTIPSKNFTIAKSQFSATQTADQSRVPCIFAISYSLAVCLPLIENTSLNGNDLVFRDVSDTLVGESVLLIPLWQINIGTSQNPNYVYGSFSKES